MASEMPRLFLRVRRVADRKWVEGLMTSATFVAAPFRPVLAMAQDPIVNTGALRLGTRTNHNVGDALNALNGNVTTINNSLTTLGNSVSIIGSGLNSLSGRVDGIERKAMQGVAVAGAMVAAPMPSEPGKTRVKVNNIFYQGYGATSVSMAHRLYTKLPAALTAGVSFGYRNTAMVGMGAEVEF
jgi:hypothetical protein